MAPKPNRSTGAQHSHLHAAVWLLLIQVIIGYSWIGIGIDRLLAGDVFTDWLALGQIFIGSSMVVCAVFLVMPQLKIYQDVALALSFLGFLVGMFLTGASYLELSQLSASAAIATTVLFWIQAILLSHIIWQLGMEHEWEQE